MKSERVSALVQSVFKTGGTILTAALLVACSGSGGESAAGTESESTPTSPEFSAQGGKKLLVIHVDGLTYDVLQQELAQYPSLQRLQMQLPLRSGGYEGTKTEQFTTALPSWASLITGVWANTHHINQAKAEASTPLQAPSLFTLLEQGSDQTQTRALIASQPEYVTLLQRDKENGTLFSVDCQENETCVTEQTQAQIDAGTTLVVAQYQQPLLAAHHGFNSSYYNEAVSQTLQHVSHLLQRVEQREQAEDSESWRILLVSSYGLDAFGLATGSQFQKNKTAWLATDAEVALQNLTEPSGKPVKALDAAAIVDMVPTVLDYFSVPLEVTNYTLNGSSLYVGDKIFELNYESEPQDKTLMLSWRLLQSEANAEPIELYRDGKLIAVLAADAQSYIDNQVGGGDSEQTVRYQYQLKKGAALASITADYFNIPPVNLDASFIENLAVYYPFSAQPPIDVKQGSTFNAWNTQNSGLSLTPIDLKSPMPTQGVAVDTSVHTQGDYAGFKLNLNRDVTADPAVRAFTIGFWFKVSGTCHGYGTSILTNKNYESGNAAGLALGLFNRNGCDIRFNTGDGGSRNEASGYNVTPNEWAYVALAIDKDQRQLLAYVIDPVLGQQNGSLKLDQSKLDALGGIKQNSLSFAEDATGQYTHRNKTVTQSAYADLAIWERALTLDEVMAIYLSRQPLSTLLP